MPTEIKIPDSSTQGPLEMLENTWKGIVDPLLALGMQPLGSSANGGSDSGTPKGSQQPPTLNFRSGTPKGRNRPSLGLAQIPEGGDVVQDNVIPTSLQEPYSASKRESQYGVFWTGRDSDFGLLSNPLELQADRRISTGRSSGIGLLPPFPDLMEESRRETQFGAVPESLDASVYGAVPPESLNLQADKLRESLLVGQGPPMPPGFNHYPRMQREISGQSVASSAMDDSAVLSEFDTSIDVMGRPSLYADARPSLCNGAVCFPYSTGTNLSPRTVEQRLLRMSIASADVYQSTMPPAMSTSLLQNIQELTNMRQEAFERYRNCANNEDAEAAMAHYQRISKQLAEARQELFDASAEVCEYAHRSAMDQSVLPIQALGAGDGEQDPADGSDDIVATTDHDPPADTAAAVTASVTATVEPASEFALPCGGVSADVVPAGAGLGGRVVLPPPASEIVPIETPTNAEGGGGSVLLPLGMHLSQTANASRTTMERSSRATFGDASLDSSVDASSVMDSTTMSAATLGDRSAFSSAAEYRQSMLNGVVCFNNELDANQNLSPRALERRMMRHSLAASLSASASELPSVSALCHGDLCLPNEQPTGMSPTALEKRLLRNSLLWSDVYQSSMPPAMTNHLLQDIEHLNARRRDAFARYRESTDNAQAEASLREYRQISSQLAEARKEARRSLLDASLDVTRAVNAGFADPLARAGPAAAAEREAAGEEHEAEAAGMEELQVHMIGHVHPVSIKDAANLSVDLAPVESCSGSSLLKAGNLPEPDISCENSTCHSRASPEAAPAAGMLDLSHISIANVSKLFMPLDTTGNGKELHSGANNENLNSNARKTLKPPPLNLPSANNNNNNNSIPPSAASRQQLKPVPAKLEGDSSAAPFSSVPAVLLKPVASGGSAEAAAEEAESASNPFLAQASALRRPPQPNFAPHLDPRAGKSSGLVSERMLAAKMVESKQRWVPPIVVQTGAGMKQKESIPKNKLAEKTQGQSAVNLERIDKQRRIGSPAHADTFNFLDVLSFFSKQVVRRPRRAPADEDGSDAAAAAEDPEQQAPPPGVNAMAPEEILQYREEILQYGAPQQKLFSSAPPSPAVEAPPQAAPENAAAVAPDEEEEERGMPSEEMQHLAQSILDAEEQAHAQAASVAAAENAAGIAGGNQAADPEEELARDAAEEEKQEEEEEEAAPSLPPSKVQEADVPDPEAPRRLLSAEAVEQPNSAGTSLFEISQLSSVGDITTNDNSISTTALPTPAVSAQVPKLHVQPVMYVKPTAIAVHSPPKHVLKRTPSKWGSGGKAFTPRHNSTPSSAGRADASHAAPSSGGTGVSAIAASFKAKAVAAGIVDSSSSSSSTAPSVQPQLPAQPASTGAIAQAPTASLAAVLPRPASTGSVKAMAAAVQQQQQQQGQSSAHELKTVAPLPATSLHRPKPAVPMFNDPAPTQAQALPAAVAAPAPSHPGAQAVPTATTTTTHVATPQREYTPQSAVSGFSSGPRSHTKARLAMETRGVSVKGLAAGMQHNENEEPEEVDERPAPVLKPAAVKTTPKKTGGNSIKDQIAQRAAAIEQRHEKKQPTPSKPAPTSTPSKQFGGSQQHSGTPTHSTPLRPLSNNNLNTPSPKAAAPGSNSAAKWTKDKAASAAKSREKGALGWQAPAAAPVDTEEQRLRQLALAETEGMLQADGMGHVQATFRPQSKRDSDLPAPPVF